MLHILDDLKLTPNNCENTHLKLTKGINLPARFCTAE